MQLENEKYEISVNFSYDDKDFQSILEGYIKNLLKSSITSWNFLNNELEYK